MEDEEIVEMYVQKDELAVHETKVKYGKQLLNLAWRIVRCREDAEECESDTYFSTWDSIPPQRPRYLRAYCMKICRNAALKVVEFKNREKRKAEMVELSGELEECIPGNGEFNVDEYECHREVVRVIGEFLKKLTDRQQAVFLKRYWELQPVGEIADEFKMSKGQVGALLFRLRKKLHDELEKEDICV